MKQLFFIILSIVLMPFYADAQAPNPDLDSDFDISISPINPNKPPKPRTLTNDIEASYSYGVVTIVFNIDLGAVYIEISNISTDDVWSDTFSGAGTLSVMLSGDEGYYLINIYTDDGGYIGEFYL